MWLGYAFASALLAGATAILAKLGLKTVDSNLATALRTIVVLIFAWLMVLLVGSQTSLSQLSVRTWLFLVLSGLATGASWLCYFRALQVGDVNRVTPIDKTSTVLTILLSSVLLQETMTLTKLISLCLIGLGTYLMVAKVKQPVSSTSRRWLWYAWGSAVFASLTAILGKVGIQGVESNLGTFIRTAVVLVMAWLVVFVTDSQTGLRQLDRRSGVFLVLSGLTTGGSWLFFYKALQTGPASIVVPIDKLSILVTVSFAYLFFGEKLTKRAFLGLVLLVLGTLSLLL